MDVRLTQINGSLDITLKGDDLAADTGLSTQVIISLFSDGRAQSVDDVPAGERGLRGVWFDTPADRFGSLLWLVGREKTTLQVCSKIEDYTRKALEWMIAEGIVGSVTAKADIVDRSTISLAVSLTRGTNRKYDQLWRGQASQINQSFLLNADGSGYSPTQ